MPKMGWARNLRPHELGGVIFLCTNDTMTECIDNQLFGLPAQHFRYVKKIKPGLPLFLLNYKQKKLHGIYEASSSGQLNIDPHAWTANGSERTNYPAQVRTVTRLQCQALDEHEFKPLIAENYFTETRFWYELDHAQASKLLSKLASVAIGPRPILPESSAKCKAAAKRFPPKNKGDKNRASEPRSSIDLHSLHSVQTTEIPDESMHLNGKEKLGEASLPKKMVTIEEKEYILLKLKELVLSRQYGDANTIGRGIEAAADHNADSESKTCDNTTMALDKMNWENLHQYSIIVAKLCAELGKLKASRQDQIRKIENLEKKMVQTEQTIHSRENRHTRLESDHYTIPKESILIVGGLDGDSCSKAVRAFSPSLDVLRSLKPMSSARSCASVARFNKELYVFGGINNTEFYNTVESYNFLNDEWTARPPMTTRRCSFAGAALDGKLFAVGGGNGVEYFSSLEMLDPGLGYWIPVRSMREKRLGLASVELNGALYVVGGLDGHSYLKSAERLDPREHSWSTLRSMEKKRCGHSLVAMNGKLYAMGGQDGTMMLTDMEIYDPRVGIWTPGESMNHGRGHFSAAVLNQSIYAIGGVERDGEIVETIECYKEGLGWTITNLKAVGHSCYAATIVYKASEWIL